MNNVSNHMPELQVGGRWRARSMGEEAELAILTGQVRRTLSFVEVRSQARLLLDRLRGIGDGADQAARRWPEEEERRMGKERKAHQLATLRGRPIRARGQFMLQQEQICLGVNRPKNSNYCTPRLTRQTSDVSPSNLIARFGHKTNY